MSPTESAGSAALEMPSLHEELPSNTPSEPMEPADIAQYIADMAGELAKMASDANLELLAYFLDMARIESELAKTRAERRPMTTLAYGMRD